MSEFEKRHHALARWKAAQPHEPTIFDVINTRDVVLIAAFVDKAFRRGVVQAVAKSRRVKKVRSAVLDAYRGDAERAEEFLRRRHPLLDGKTPLELAAASDDGAEAVILLIGRAANGSAV